MTSETRLKVLMTTDTVGGVWTYCLELARSLLPHDTEIVLATMGPAPRPQQARAAAALSNVTVCQSSWKLEWMPDPWDDVRAAGEWLSELEGRHRPDLVHLNGYAHGDLPWRAPVLMVGHSCVLSWWRAVKGEDAPAEWETYRTRVCAGLNAADLTVAPSRAMLRALGDHYGRPIPGRVIYNGRDPSLFPTDRPKRPLILSAGRLWDQAKNLAALEQAAAGLPWPVYVAGDDRSPGGSAVATGRTRALGRLAPRALARWLADASIYCLPARYEPFGLSALEAALSGCALVLGDIASLREIWGDAALFVPPDDVGALRATLLALIGQPSRRDALARRARERAARYTPQRMAGAYLSAYRHLTAKSRGPTLENAGNIE